MDIIRRGKTHYSQQDKKHFFRCLNAYREALRTKTNIVCTSLAVYAALGQVPKHYRRYVTKAFNSGGTE